MTESIEAQQRPEGHGSYTLRKAMPEDLVFLFKVSTDAMRPVVSALNPDKEFNNAEEFEKYKAKFNPDAIEIIQYEGEDVGRLRVVRSPESIYIGGIQILPAFQNRGIGTALFADLITEARQLQKPIVLEVHDVNEAAISFYKKLGFEEGEKVGDQTIVRYVPKD